MTGTTADLIALLRQDAKLFMLSALIIQREEAATALKALQAELGIQKLHVARLERDVIGTVGEAVDNETRAEKAEAENKRLRKALGIIEINSKGDIAIIARAALKATS